MAERLKLKAGAKITAPALLFEGFEIKDGRITANVSAYKIEAVMQHFILIHPEPLFFILELPSNADDETERAPGIVDALHTDVWYLDGCSQQHALAILQRFGGLLCQDGLSSFGFGGHESGDEILSGKYNVLTVFGRELSRYADFFSLHGIEETDGLFTAWDTFSAETSGESNRVEQDGITVFDIPAQLNDYGIYLAKRRED
ncbi:MAG: hypothetical protein IJK89_00230 [Clostridia bacterium]|nr:hypothetical protein [Clostridia bacterium]